jgi:tagatose-6-phosphate ketose/aldose isomerase
MVIFGQCLAHQADLDAYEPVLLTLVAAARNFLPSAADCAAALAKEEYRKACFVASGPLKAVAKESALKLLEMTAGKTLTMSESALGLRHGPMAALDQDTLLVCFLSESERVQAYERDLLREVGNKRLAGSRIVIAGGAQGKDSYAEHHLALAELGSVADEYRTPVDVISGQLLGLFFSIQWKLMPDCPSPSGVISRRQSERDTNSERFPPSQVNVLRVPRPDRGNRRQSWSILSLLGANIEDQQDLR